MTTLREKMKTDMELIGLAASTQAIYIKKLEALHDYYGCSPAKLDDDALKQYLLHLKQRELAPNTYNTHVYALRFFFASPKESHCVNWRCQPPK